MEPNEVAARAPLIEATKAQLPPEVAKLDDPFVQNFNAASEPELVNALQKRLADGSAPQAIVDLAKDRGVASDGKLMDLVPKLRMPSEKYETPSRMGDTEKAATLLGKVTDITDLLKTHGQAIDLMMQARGVTPEDIAAQSDAHLGQVRAAAAQSAGSLLRGEPMPFESQAQRAWMYSQHPEMAKRWEKETPKGLLPRKVGDKPRKEWATPKSKRKDNS